MSAKKSVKTTAREELFITLLRELDRLQREILVAQIAALVKANELTARIWGHRHGPLRIITPERLLIWYGRPPDTCELTGKRSRHSDQDGETA